MKVLRAGIVPEPPPKSWPIDVEIICPFCACLFAPETDADFTIRTERYPGRRYIALMSCPTCDVFFSVCK